MSKSEQDERILDNLDNVDWATADYDELSELFEDRDPLEFL